MQTKTNHFFFFLSHSGWWWSEEGAVLEVWMETWTHLKKITVVKWMIIAVRNCTDPIHPVWNSWKKTIHVVLVTSCIISARSGMMPKAPEDLLERLKGLLGLYLKCVGARVQLTTLQAGLRRKPRSAPPVYWSSLKPSEQLTDSSRPSCFLLFFLNQIMVDIVEPH